MIEVAVLTGTRLEHKMDRIYRINKITIRQEKIM